MKTIILDASFGIPELLLVVIVIGIVVLLVTLAANNARNKKKDESRLKGRKETQKRNRE